MSKTADEVFGPETPATVPADTTPKTTAETAAEKLKQVEQDSATPSKRQREQALVLAIDLAKSHINLRSPGEFALVFAAEFAQYLADGTLPTALQADVDADNAPAASQEER